MCAFSLLVVLMAAGLFAAASGLSLGAVSFSCHSDGFVVPLSPEATCSERRGRPGSQTAGSGELTARMAACLDQRAPTGWAAEAPGSAIRPSPSCGNIVSQRASTRSVWPRPAGHIAVNISHGVCASVIVSARKLREGPPGAGWERAEEWWAS